MKKISQILTPRSEVLEGNFQGALQAHQVHSEAVRLESDPPSLFRATWPSDGIRNVIDRCRQKMNGNDHQGGFLLAGPYGAGKTHALILLYHLFNEPSVGRNWLEEWHIDFEVPDSSRAVVLSTSEVDADQLWVPIYQALGREDLLEQVKRYPTIPLIEELAGRKPLAIFLDEIETWYGSLSRDEPETIEQNQMFLQNLLEVAADKDQRVFVFITLLNKSDELKRILLRTSPIHEDLSASGDREKLILHRLVETPRDVIDDDAVREIAKAFVDAYEFPIELAEPARYRQRMEETYPFHPQLLGLMDRVYESAAERQNVRGAMNVLADALGELYDESSLILTSDLDEAALRGINMQLVHRFNYDAEENEDTRDIPHAKEMLRTILLFTLDAKSQAATTSDILLGTYQKSVGSLNELTMSLSELVGRAHYLHRDDGHFQIREDLNLVALVDRESRQIQDFSEANQELFRLVRRAVFSGDVTIYEEADEILDRQAIDYVVLLSAPESSGELHQMLEDFYHGRQFQNTVVFICQEGPSLLTQDELLNKAKRIAAAVSLQSRIEDPKGELQALINEERRELAGTLKSQFGRLVQWASEEGNDKPKLRLIPTQPSAADVREKIGTDRSYVADHVLAELKNAQAGKRIDALLKDFKKLRRLPVLLDDEVLYGAVRSLYDDGRIVIEGDRAKWHVPGRDAPPKQMRDDLTVHHTDHVPDYVLRPPEPEREDEKPPIVRPDDDEQPEVERKVVIEYLPLEGNSPRSVVSMAEARIHETNDRVRNVKLILTFQEPLSKAALLDLLEALPDSTHISVDLEVERDKSDD